MQARWLFTPTIIALSFASHAASPLSSSSLEDSDLARDFMSFYNGNSQIMTNICVIPCYGLYDLYSNTKAPVRLMCSPVPHPSPAARFPTKLLACLIHGLSTRMSPLAQEGSPVQKLGGSICYNGLITLMTIEIDGWSMLRPWLTKFTPISRGFLWMFLKD